MTLGIFLVYKAVQSKLSKKIFTVLRDRIINLEYEPETLLSENTLCKEFEVSRTPLREALNQLADMNLIQAIPRYGTVVKPINVNEIRSAYEMKVHLEYLAGLLAAQRITEQKLAELKRVLDEFEQANQNGESAVDKDVSFHEVVYEATRNSVLEQTMKRLTSQCLRFCLLIIPEHLEASEGIVELRQIFQAIAIKDPELSGRLCQEHAQYYLDRIREAAI